jgi:hypothetical protein
VVGAALAKWDPLKSKWDSARSKRDWSNSGCTKWDWSSSGCTKRDWSSSGCTNNPFRANPAEASGFAALQAGNPSKPCAVGAAFTSACSGSFWVGYAGLFGPPSVGSSVPCSVSPPGGSRVGGRWEWRELAEASKGSVGSDDAAPGATAFDNASAALTNTGAAGSAGAESRSGGAGAVWATNGSVVGVGVANGSVGGSTATALVLGFSRMVP